MNTGSTYYILEFDGFFTFYTTVEIIILNIAGILCRNIIFSQMKNIFQSLFVLLAFRFCGNDNVIKIIKIIKPLGEIGNTNFFLFFYFLFCFSLFLVV